MWDYIDIVCYHGDMFDCIALLHFALPTVLDLSTVFDNLIFIPGPTTLSLLTVII